MAWKGYTEEQPIGGLHGAEADTNLAGREALQSRLEAPM